MHREMFGDLGWTSKHTENADNRKSKQSPLKSQDTQDYDLFSPLLNAKKGTICFAF